MPSNFFAFLSRMKHINRWGLMRNTQIENLKEHSFDVAVIAHALAVIGNIRFGKTLPADEIAAAALFHDCSEIITGDLPTPVKYYSDDIKNAYKKAEAAAKKRIVALLPQEFRGEYGDIIYSEENRPEIYTYIKAADVICAYIKCVEERTSGNREFCEAEKSTLERIKKLDMPEADFFLQEFAEGYGLSLDSQK